MTLITRVSRLFRADMHGILDWLEEPETVLKQAVRDMESEIEGGEVALEQLVEKKEKLDSFVQQLSGDIAQYCKQIEVCFDEENLENDNFSRAHRAAEEAIRTLAKGAIV